MALSLEKRSEDSKLPSSLSADRQEETLIECDRGSNDVVWKVRLVERCSVISVAYRANVPVSPS